MMHPHSESEEFLKAYDAHADALLRHCYFRVYDREKAKDVVQETYIRAWKYLAEGRQVDNLRAFLYKVANNLIIDLSRKRKEMSLDMLQEQGFDPGEDSTDSLLSRIDARAAVAMIEYLEEPYRSAVVMRYLDDMSPKEIAVVFDESENTISVRIHRGIKKLQLLAHRQKNEREV